MFETFRSLILSEQKKGTYAGYKYSEETEKVLNAFIDNNNIPNPNREFHTTLLYSTVEAPDYVPAGRNIDVSPVTFAGFHKYGAALVIKLDAPYMKQRHEDLMSDFEELVYDYDTYEPHITLSYDAEDFDIESLDPSAFDVFNFHAIEEYGEALNLEWVGTNA